MVSPREGVPPRVKHAVFALIAVASVANLLGTAFSPYLLVHHPLVLIGLSPVGRHVVLAAPSVALTPMLLVAPARRVIGLLASYGLGAIYGDQAVTWAEKRYPRFGRFIRWVERLFARWGPILLVIAPTHTVAILAGAGGTKARTLLLCAGIGELIWVVATYYFGELISDWTEPAIEFVSRHLVESTLIVLAIVILQQVLSRQRTNREEG